MALGFEPKIIGFSARILLLYESQTGFVFTMRLPIPPRHYTGTVRIELTSLVLETSVLPLNYEPMVGLK